MPDIGFTEIVEKYTNLVYNVALRMTGNPQDAEDVVQEVFLSVYKALPRFRADAQVSTWLYRIAVNACLMKARKEKNARYLVDAGYEDIDIPDWSESPEKAALNAELHGAIREGLARLPPDLRAAVVLRDVQGLSGEEAAAAAGVPVATLKTRLHRGRLLLRKYLQGYVGGKR